MTAEGNPRTTRSLCSGERHSFSAWILLLALSAFLAGCSLAGPSRSGVDDRSAPTPATSSPGGTGNSEDEDDSDDRSGGKDTSGENDKSDRNDKSDDKDKSGGNDTSDGNDKSEGNDNADDEGTSDRKGNSDGKGKADGKGKGVGSPLRIPLPTDELLGLPVTQAKDVLRNIIGRACGGRQCIKIVEVPNGSQERAGRKCDATVTAVPGTRWEGDIPVLYIPRGGTIELVVILECEADADGSEPNEDNGSEPSEDNGSGSEPNDDNGSKSDPNDGSDASEPDTQSEANGSEPDQESAPDTADAQP